MTYDAFGFGLRSEQHEDRRYFHLRDVTRVLHAANPQRIIEGLDPDEILTLDQITGTPSDSSTVLITEPAVFRIALRMQSREARALLRFVCHEVLPALRGAGSFKLPARATRADGTGLIRYLRENIAEAKPSAAPRAAEIDLPW